MPFGTWIKYGNYLNKKERIADLGCGPADILRFLDRNCLPEFYLGIDVSDDYLKIAKKKAHKMGLHAEFIRLDLEARDESSHISNQLMDTLNKYKITIVNLFGVLHHLADPIVQSTLRDIAKCHSIKHINTQDVLYIEGNLVNNFYVSLDRGKFIRSEIEYDILLDTALWPVSEKAWSYPGVSKVKYIHYKLSR